MSQRNAVDHPGLEDARTDVDRRWLPRNGSCLTQRATKAPRHQDRIYHMTAGQREIPFPTNKPRNLAGNSRDSRVGTLGMRGRHEE